MADPKGSIVENYAFQTPMESVQSQSLTLKYFTKELYIFRKIMCSTKHTIIQKDAAFEGLTYLYLNTESMDKKDSEKLITAYQAIMTEWIQRRAYQPDFLIGEVTL